MLIETLSMDYRKARSVNQTSGTFVSKIPQIAEPIGDAASATGSSVIDLAYNPLGNYAPPRVKVLPYGVGADNTTFNMRVIGWNRITIGGDPNKTLWVPVNLLEVACTLSLAAGVAGTPVVATEFFCDILTVVTGSTLGGELALESLISTSNDTIGMIEVNMHGFQKLELSFNVGVSATSANALLGLL